MVFGSFGQDRINKAWEHKNPFDPEFDHDYWLIFLGICSFLITTGAWMAAIIFRMGIYA